MKAVLISIRPKWCELVASGKKMVEVRKTKPKIETPFKVYIYETQGRTETPFVDEEGHHIFKGRGQVIGEFVCRRIDTYPYNKNGYGIAEEHLLCTLSCIEEKELYHYLQGSKPYAWNISDLVIYGKPRSIGEFCKPCDPDPQCDCQYCMTHGRSPSMTIKRAPQSWCYVEERR